MIRSCIIIFTSIYLLLSPLSLMAETEEKPAEPSYSRYVWNFFAWYLVPVTSETVIMAATHMAPKGSLTKTLVQAYSPIIRDATNKHVISSLGSSFEQFSYRQLTFDPALKKTANLSRELTRRAHQANAHTSSFAQAGMKIYFRFNNIFSSLADSIALRHPDTSFEDIARLLAFSAYYLTYNHPELSHGESIDYIKPSLDRYHELRSERMRQRVIDVLSFMDPAFDEVSLIQLNYCELLNTWGVGNDDCHRHLLAAKSESQHLFSGSHYLDRLHLYLSGRITEDKLQGTLFLLGLAMPGLLHTLKSIDVPYLPLLESYTLPVLGKTLHQDKLEQWSSDVRRWMEGLGMYGLEHSQTDYAQHYFQEMQSNTSRKLSDLTNFARTNTQRVLETTLQQLSTAQGYVELKQPAQAYSVLAALHLQLMHETVESDASNLMLRAALLAYRPITDPTAISLVFNTIQHLKPDDINHNAIRDEHEKRLSLWHHYSTLSIPNVAQKKVCSEMECLRQPLEEYKSAVWQREPDTCSPCDHLQPPRASAPPHLSTNYIHLLTLAYYLGSSYGMKQISNHITPSGHSMKAAGFISTALLFTAEAIYDLLNRSVPTLSTSLLKTDLKQKIGTLTGQFDESYAIRHDRLLTEDLQLSQRLSNEAQISRFNKGILEPLLLELWRQANFHLTHSHSSDQVAAVIAYAAYYLQCLYPELESNDRIIGILAKGTLRPLQEHLQHLTQKERKAFFQTLFSYIARHDPNISEPSVQRKYVALLSSWGLHLSIETEFYEDIESNWSEYSSLILYAVGVTGKVTAKAAVRQHPIAIQLAVSVFSNILESGTAEALRKRTEAVSQQWLLSLESTYQPYESDTVEPSNTELTQNYRRLHPHFSKAGSNARNALTQLIAGVLAAMRRSQQAYLDNDFDRMHDQIAQALRLVVVLSPNIKQDDYILLQAINAFSPTGWHAVNDHDIPLIIHRLMEMIPEDVQSEFNPKSDAQLEIWINLFRQNQTNEHSG